MANNEDSTSFTEHDDHFEEDLLKSELVSPEMVLGMTTRLSEESTATTELALEQLHLNETAMGRRHTIAVAESSQTEQIEAPNVKKILKFAIPAIGVWLCGPILSLIDTSAVGLLSGTAQQAALNPAVAVTEYAALLIVSLFI
jgi:hypothetical protein